MNVPESFRSLQGKLIVSCQAEEQDAFYGQMGRFARAAAAGGAAAIRANGPDDIRAIRAAVSLPVIGIQKTRHADGQILITPSFESARQLVEAGATMIALDCTKRAQRYAALDRLQRIKSELGVPVLADIATVDEAMAAADAGADCVLSTMRGYTDDTLDVTHFSSRFIAELAAAVSVPIIAEGRVDSPETARHAIRAGAFAVVVGTSITRPHSVSRLFAAAIEQEYARATRERWLLGIDLGGTNTKAGLVSWRGDIVWNETAPTPAQGGRIGLLKNLENVALRGLAQAAQLGYEVEAIGIGTAGWVNTRSGDVVYATENLPGWTGTRIAEIISQAVGVPVYVDNDANASAAGEKAFGAARTFDDFVCITLGTGVGGGCFIGGHLNHGAHFFANAFGHMCIEPQGRACNCGQHGCLEAYTNVAAALEYAEGQYPDAMTLIQAANAGETIAVHAIQRLSARLAMGCSLLVQLLDPEALILGGGLAQNNPILLAALERELAVRVPVWEQRALKIMPSSIGYHAGVLGAAAVVFSATAETDPA